MPTTPQSFRFCFLLCCILKDIILTRHENEVISSFVLTYVNAPRCQNKSRPRQVIIYRRTQELAWFPLVKAKRLLEEQGKGNPLKYSLVLRLLPSHIPLRIKQKCRRVKSYNLKDDFMFFFDFNNSSLSIFVETENKTATEN